MPFNSYAFIFGFIPVVICGYWSLARFPTNTAAIAWLILSSVVFYAYGGIGGLAIIGPSSAINYLLARTMSSPGLSKTRSRRVLLAFGVTANVLILAYFKYGTFLLQTTNAMLGTHFRLVQPNLPLGISFITFQMIAFLADVYSGQVKNVRLRDFLVFTFFFPRAVAVPIVHYQEVMPQLENRSSRNFWLNAAIAVCLFSAGLFKKAIIADNIEQFVSPAFDLGPGDSPPDLYTAWSGALAYTFQLYFDFSGYSDMALGLARLFGVALPMNFNSPLKAHSMVEFWGRWHVSLTRFLTAYIYTPIVLQLTRIRTGRGKPVLRGRRSEPSAVAILVALPTVVTMGISGCWHGAGWQFFIWGLLHGFYLAVNQTWRIFRPRFWSHQSSYERFMKPTGFLITFGAVVVSFVFFRATSVTSALSILSGMAGENGVLPLQLTTLLNSGIHLDWQTIWELGAPLRWVVVLFLGVTLLPNSLELLRSYQPALDFPAISDTERDSQLMPASVSAPPQSQRKFPPEARGEWFSALKRLFRGGVTLNALTASAIALLFVLGVIALNRGSAFLYWKF